MTPSCKLIYGTTLVYANICKLSVISNHFPSIYNLKQINLEQHSVERISRQEIKQLHLLTPPPCMGWLTSNLLSGWSCQIGVQILISSWLAAVGHIIITFLGTSVHDLWPREHLNLNPPSLSCVRSRRLTLSCQIWFDNLQTIAEMHRHILRSSTFIGIILLGWFVVIGNIRCSECSSSRHWLLWVKCLVRLPTVGSK